MVRRVLHLVREIAASEGSVVTADDDAADVQSLGYATRSSKLLSSTCAVAAQARAALTMCS